MCRRLALDVLLRVGACTDTPRGSGDHAPYTSRTSLGSWPTYHRDPSRSGHVRAGPSGPLQEAWRRNLAGQVYGEPLLAAGAAGTGASTPGPTGTGWPSSNDLPSW